MAKSVTSLSSTVLIYINRREKEREREREREVKSWSSYNRVLTD